MTSSTVIENLIEARVRDLGEFEVRRVLPAGRQRQMVGPFIFFDHVGPTEFAPGSGVAVRPHPHIGLATVTYLFAGEIVHRDSLGSVQTIRPGDVNWMIAGRGIVHSERSDPALLDAGATMHGVQSWVALPLEHEETAPAFDHHPAASLPAFERAGVSLRVIAGTAYGARSPVATLSPTLYVDARMPAGSTLELETEHEERAVYPVQGEIRVGGEQLRPGSMAVLAPGRAAVVQARGESRVMLVGGAPLEGERHVWWNFVSSSGARIEKAKADWREGRFEGVAGDDEFIPLPAS